MTGHLPRSELERLFDADWKYSLAWIQERRNLVTPRAYASFLMTWISTFAARRGDWKAMLPLLREAYRYGWPSIIDFLVFWGNWLLPRSVQRLIATINNQKHFRLKYSQR